MNTIYSTKKFENERRYKDMARTIRVKIYKSAITGRFVKRSTAERHPKVTYAQTVTKRK
ncbi:hypothetical protein SAMN05444682_11719 [Parapedobacter indicus]|uniref:Uncharacterized protein n=1 Tax=Parapedobacter indicus TaxID=1477437 RepID=A0A1I3VL80_9SPHI|nr:hypothetical protein CLV26_11729 [Parapedobacter indicus]SFJ94921.1 hypothetical protein SAMN05444682_11719 [Parapedobacter indicus]